MRILDKYSLKQIAKCYIFILIMFVGFYLFIELSSNLTDLIRTKPPIGVIFSYYINMLPVITLTVSRYALLISMLYITGLLNKNNEILSMRASGVSIMRLAFPLLFFAFIVSCTVFFVQEKILTKAQKNIEEIQMKFIKKDFSKNANAENIAFISNKNIIFARNFSSELKTMYDVISFIENKNNIIVSKIFAKSAVYSDEQWIGNDVTIYDFDENGTIISAPKHRSEYGLSIKDTPNELLIKQKSFFKTSSIRDLSEQIARLKRLKAYNLLANLKIEFYQRIVTPFAHLFLILGILPLALEIRKRRGGFSSLSIGFICSLFYYSFESFSIVLAKEGYLLPIFGIALAPLFFVTIGITGLLLIR
ncbi:MAG: LptF/LptG family permease [Candidatus Omnitrophica bacterium]|nr:LptF/LptG family permease [Candidatus Omnitrophota bacterium]MDD5081134.1 LptF/LptG family permease [Candidatus Omnitrophota bacterium]MDD5440999.1 LptF/LptG family permease [Candidatus Omnitrophota bacterium]